MTAWDLRAFGRALAATVLCMLVVWLVTAASDEGQLTAGVRAGRTLPIAPLCSAVGAALALGTARIRQEARALEALGRSPSQAAWSAAVGACLPSILVGLVLAVSPSVDVSGFYPRPPLGDAFVYTDGYFSSPSLGVRVGPDGDLQPMPRVEVVADAGLPRHARLAASVATAAAGLALAVVAAHGSLQRSLESRARRRRRRLMAAVKVLGCSLFMLVALQGAAARVFPAALAMVPAALLLGIEFLGYRARHE